MGEPMRPSVAVLIVEDEPLIRMGTVYLIEDAGFEVYEAGSADAAIALLELHKEIRLIFTDVDMPGSMDGLKLAHYVRGRWPPVKIIVTSGHIKVTEESLPMSNTRKGDFYESGVCKPEPSPVPASK
jgi:two-component system, response regulator PdtaR